MRKRIAVFANGWGSEYLQQVGEGIEEVAAKADADVFYFVNFSVHAFDSVENQGEFNIMTLPDLKDFDSAILLTNSFNLQSETDYLQKQIEEAKIPAVSLLIPLEHCAYVEADNYSGAYDVTEHLIQKHGAKNLLFIGGFKEHEECRMRLHAVKSAANANGAVLLDADILFGDWSAKSAENCMESWLRYNRRLPDAIICANDVMAMAVCDLLNSRGIKVPEQIMVTGFDCLKEGREHWPSLTSVSQEWRQMGQMAARNLIDRMNGQECEMHIRVESKMTFGMSCGCVTEEEWEKTYIGNRKESSVQKVNGMAVDQHFRHLYMAIRKDKSLDDLHHSLSAYYLTESWMEGKDIRICINPEFFKTIDNEEAMKQVGYPDVMDVVCSMADGKAEKLTTMTRKESIFHTSDQSDKAGVYLFVPIHSDSVSYGYAMLGRNIDIVGDNILYIWTRHMRQDMEQIRSNIQIEELTKRLEALSVTDGLTGAYNRNGCEQILYPFAEEVQKSGHQIMFFIADLDRLKQINDCFGHANGDMALKLVAKAIREAVPEGFMVARFGGDEFLVIGEYNGQLTVEELEDRIYQGVKAEGEKANVGYSISLSTGGILVEQGKPFDVKECLQTADKRMYQIKKEHHRVM